MRYFIIILLPTLLSLSFLQKSQAQSGVDYVSGIALLQATSSFNLALFKEKMASLGSENFSEKDQVYSMDIRQSKVTLKLLSEPVAKSEWEAAAMISWIWKTAATDVEKHQAQIVITISGKDHLPLDLYKTFTKVAEAVLESSDAIGIYMNNQYLLLPKVYYLTGTSNLNEGVLPVTLWVYFGMWQENGKNSGYTWGLQGFGKTELEIVNSTHGIATIQAFLQETARDIISKNEDLKSGDYVGDERKIMVHVSKGVLIEGQTAKLDY